MPNLLELFDPLVARWFKERYPSATDIQRCAWQAISRNRHVLMSAPTGSGKTMAAFLWALNQLICGRWSPGRPRVLYVSPLKALNNDIRRNLLEPMAALQDLFENRGRPFPPIHVSTRSGDTTP
jgi:ATP-dependent Lhr-like helicase